MAETAPKTHLAFSNFSHSSIHIGCQVRLSEHGTAFAGLLTIHNFLQSMRPTDLIGQIILIHQTIQTMEKT